MRKLYVFNINTNDALFIQMVFYEQMSFSHELTQYLVNHRKSIVYKYQRDTDARNIGLFLKNKTFTLVS